MRVEEFDLKEPVVLLAIGLKPLDSGIDSAIARELLFLKVFCTVLPILLPSPPEMLREIGRAHV